MQYLIGYGKKKEFYFRCEDKKGKSFEQRSNLFILKTSLWHLCGDSEIRSQRPEKGRHCSHCDEGLDGDDWQGEAEETMDLRCSRR